MATLLLLSMMLGATCSQTLVGQTGRLGPSSTLGSISGLSPLATAGTFTGTVGSFGRNNFAQGVVGENFGGSSYLNRIAALPNAFRDQLALSQPGGGPFAGDFSNTNSLESVQRLFGGTTTGFSPDVTLGVGQQQLGTGVIGQQLGTRVVGQQLGTGLIGTSSIGSPLGTRLGGQQLGAAVNVAVNRQLGAGVNLGVGLPLRTGVDFRGTQQVQRTISVPVTGVRNQIPGLQLSSTFGGLGREFGATDLGLGGGGVNQVGVRRITVNTVPQTGAVGTVTTTETVNTAPGTQVIVAAQPARQEFTVQEEGVAVVPVQPATAAPEYFTTVNYGPVVEGGISGSGQQSSVVSYTREGSAAGSLFSVDQAEAKEDATKTRGYEYDYSLGHDYEQPRELFNYDQEEEIWGVRVRAVEVQPTPAPTYVAQAGW